MDSASATQRTMPEIFFSFSVRTLSLFRILQMLLSFVLHLSFACTLDVVNDLDPNVSRGVFQSHFRTRN